MKAAIRATREAAGKASDAVETVDVRGAASAAKAKVGAIRTKHKRKIWAAVGLAAALGLAKVGTTGFDAVQDYRKATATEKANEVPRDRIVIPVTIQAQDGNIKITPKSGVKTDQCGQEHTLAITPVAGEAMRKGRTKAAKGTVRFTVEAHGETHTYEADEDIVADGEEREYTLAAHLVAHE